VHSIDRTLAELSELARSEPAQSRGLEPLRRPIAEKMAELRETIELRKSGGLVAALPVVLTDQGKRSMEEIRSQVDRLQSLELDRLEELSARSHADARRASQAEALGVLVALGLLGFAYWAISRELAERRRMEADLSRLAALVESTEDAIIGLTIDGLVASWNRGAEHLYGYAAAEMLGQRCDRLLPAERRGDLDAEMGRVRRGESAEHREAVRIHKDVSLIDVWLRVSPVRDGAGTIIGASKIARNIGENKRAEALLLQKTTDLEAARRRLSATAEFGAALNQSGMLETYRTALACIGRTIHAPMAVIYDARDGAPPVTRCAVGLDQRLLEASPFEGEGLPWEAARSGVVQVLEGPFDEDALRLRIGLGDVRIHAVVGWPIAFRGRFLEEALHSAVSFSIRHDLPLSLVMLDVDAFKQYNDSFGHPAGDDVLRAVAGLLRDSVREHDVVARYGGEEFAILLPATDADSAHGLAERLRRSIAEHAWTHRTVTASLGITTMLPDEPVTPTALVEAADGALYHSKHRGRNRVTHRRDLHPAAGRPQVVG
jgi:diguanylate cyclase (GGDEF)-like protein/PAS domain S-box-containing protein